MSEDNFQIMRLAALLETPGMNRSLEYFRVEFWALTDFLQRNGLTARVLAKTPEDIKEDFTIFSNDLTTEGLKFMRIAFYKWLDKIDGTDKRDDVSYLEKQLKKLRAQ